MEIYSPGEMSDGSIIQDRDSLSVPTTRRNPVLADVCNRLGYMERKGSGYPKEFCAEIAFNISEEVPRYKRAER